MLEVDDVRKASGFEKMGEHWVHVAKVDSRTPYRRMSPEDAQLEELRRELGRVASDGWPDRQFHRDSAGGLEAPDGRGLVRVERVGDHCVVIADSTKKFIRPGATHAETKPPKQLELDPENRADVEAKLYEAVLHVMEPVVPGNFVDPTQDNAPP